MMASKKTNLGKDRKTSWTGEELIEQDLGEVQWLVRNILPQGFFFLAGRPKIGKSFMTLQLCSSIVAGQKFLGNEVLQKGRVLYISLEDNRRRLKKRIMNMGLFTDAKDLSLLEVEERWDPLNKGGALKLVERLSKKKYVLCVIDTYAKAFLMKDNNDAVEATRCLAPLYELTRGGDFSFGFVHHHRKNTQYSGDVIADISASGAKGGVADTVWSLRRERGKQNAFLEIASRDAEVDRLDLIFDKDRTMWVPQEQEIVKPGTVQAKILSHMGSNGTEVYIRELAKKLGYDPSFISREMVELTKKGLVYKEVEKAGKYGKVPYKLIKDKKLI